MFCQSENKERVSGSSCPVLAQSFIRHKKGRILMALESIKEAQFHPKKTLVPRSVVKGGRMWSVALEKTMFTYFEIDPDSQFDLHSHVNEQITMVLEGELFFRFRGRIVCVKKGDVIAIPSNTPHQAFTQNNPVIAVDAWSPVVEKYKNKDTNKYAQETERILAGCIGMKP
ncbi:cupin domain-containing protein [Acidobacteriota bacterium]